MKGRTFLKITGFIMIVGGIFAIVSGITALLVSGTSISILEEQSISGMFYASWIIYIVSGVFEIIAGIMGFFKERKVADTTYRCILFTAVVIILNVICIIINNISGNKLDIIATLAGVLFPILYIYGLVLNKKYSNKN